MQLNSSFREAPPVLVVVVERIHLVDVRKVFELRALSVTGGPCLLDEPSPRDSVFEIGPSGVE